MSLKIVTANRLRDGLVVFLGRNGDWTERVADSRAVEGEDAAALLLAEAENAARRQAIVGPYLIDATLDAGAPVPSRYRERIRADGPSVETRGSVASRPE